MTVYNSIMGELVCHKLLFIAQHDLTCNLDIAVCVPICPWELSFLLSAITL
jgi:hypothetical protein